MKARGLLHLSVFAVQMRRRVWVVGLATVLHGCGAPTPPPKVTAASSMDLAAEVAALAPTYADGCTALHAWAALDDTIALTAVTSYVEDVGKTESGDRKPGDFVCHAKAAGLRLVQRVRTKTLDLNADLVNRVAEVRIAAATHVLLTGVDVDRSRVRALLSDPRTEVRASAIGAIVRLRDTDAIPDLQALARKPVTAFDRKELEPYTVVDDRGVKVVHFERVPPEVKARERLHMLEERMRINACGALRALGKSVADECSATETQTRFIWNQKPKRSKRPPDGDCAIMRSRLRRSDDVMKTLDDYVFDRVKPFEYAVSMPFADLTWHPCPLPVETMSKLRAGAPPVRQRLALILTWDRHLLTMKKVLPHLATPDGSEKLLQAELDENPMSMTFADDFFPKDFVPTGEPLSRATFEAKLVERTRRPHPEHPAEYVECFRVHLMNRDTKTTIPTFGLIDDERFRYFNEASVWPASAKLCSAEPGPRHLRPHEAADVWIPFHLPSEAKAIALHIYTSEIKGDVEVFDGGAIRLTL